MEYSKEFKKATEYRYIANEFKEAVWILTGHFDIVQRTSNVARPTYYCAGHAIELFLKAYLTLGKVEAPYKHDLEYLVDLCEKNIAAMCTLTDTDRSLINLLNGRYKNYELKYDVLERTYSPHPDLLNGLLARMIAHLDELINKELVSD